MSILPVVALLIPLAISPVTLAGKVWHCPRLVERATLAAPILTLVVLVIAALQFGGDWPLHHFLGGWHPPVGIALRLDGLAWLGSVLAMIVATSALLFAQWERKYTASFYFLFLMLLVSVMGVLLTDDLFNMFLFFEVGSIAAAILIAYPGNRRSLVASIQYLLISALGMALFLLGLFFLYQATGILSLTGIEAALGTQEASIPGFTLAMSLVVAGIALKAAIVPLHTWLPEAYARAPHPISAMLSGVMTGIALLTIWRIAAACLYWPAMGLFITLGPLSAVAAAIWALAQRENKRLLAFASISSMGLVLCTLAGGETGAPAPAMYYLFNHGLYKGLLFLAVGSAIVARQGSVNSGNGGSIFRRWPPIVALLIGVASGCGLPPLGGYASKAAMLEALGSNLFLKGAVLAAEIITIAAFLRLASSILLHRSRGTTGAHAPKQRQSAIPGHTGLLYAALYVPAVAVVLLGLFPHLWLNQLGRILHLPINQVLPDVWAPIHLLHSGVSFTLGALLYWLSRAGLPRRLLTSLGRRRTSLTASLVLVIGGFLLIVVLYWQLSVRNI